MEAESQAAEQVVRITLAGSETLVRLTGAGAKNLAALLVAASSSREKTKGKARLESMLRAGKELSVFTVPSDSLKDFAREARRYGVLYTVVREKGATRSTDLIVRAEDASTVTRIVERLSLGSVWGESSAAPAAPETPDAEAPREGAASARGTREQARALIDSITSAPREGAQRSEEEKPPFAPCSERDPRSASTSGPERNFGRTGSEAVRGSSRPSLKRRIREMEELRRAPTREKTKAPAPRSAAPSRKGKAR